MQVNLHLHLRLCDVYVIVAGISATAPLGAETQAEFCNICEIHKKKLLMNQNICFSLLLLTVSPDDGKLSIY